MRIAIVFNPKSGQRTASSTVGTVVSSIASHNHEMELIDCRKQPDFERHLRAHAHQFDRAIVIGGDGTLNGTVNAIATSEHPDLPLAFVPRGRGKDTARTLPSWQPDALALGAFEHAQVQRVDLIHMHLANGVRRYAINISSIGLAARAAGIANTFPRFLGTLSYVAGAARGLVPPRPYTLRLEIDGKEETVDNVLLVAACNGRSIGGGMYLAPLADPHDGLLDVVVVRNANLGDLALQLGKLKSGKPFDHPALSRWLATTVQIEHLKHIHAEADGEMLSSQPINYEIAPGALNWITP